MSPKNEESSDICFYYSTSVILFNKNTKTNEWWEPWEFTKKQRIWWESISYMDFTTNHIIILILLMSYAIHNIIVNFIINFSTDVYSSFCGQN